VTIIDCVSDETGKVSLLPLGLGETCCRPPVHITLRLLCEPTSSSENVQVNIIIDRLQENAMFAVRIEQLAQLAEIVRYSDVQL